MLLTHPFRGKLKKLNRIDTKARVVYNKAILVSYSENKMCSIVGSYSKNKLIELCKLNEYRGQASHSISYYDSCSGKIHVYKAKGPIDYDMIEIPDWWYCIVHMQAPTTESDNIHPAEYNKGTKSYLWHNGIIKQSYISRLQEITGLNSNWDTELLLNLLQEYPEKLDEVDGSFSCVYYKRGSLHLFRNRIAPLFYDEWMNISSTKFEGSKAVEHDTIFEIDLCFDVRPELMPVKHFKTAVNPYFFGGR